MAVGSLAFSLCSAFLIDLELSVFGGDLFGLVG
jgi:hypothetical protein